MEDIEQAAEQFLARIPTYVWDGATLPVPIEEIADTHVGLLVRDAEDLGTAPGGPARGPGQALSGLLLPAVGEIWSTPKRPASGRRDAASPSPTSSGTGAFTGTPSAASSADLDRLSPRRRRLVRQFHRPRTRPTCSPLPC